MKLFPLFPPKAKVTALPGPIAARVIVADIEQRPAAIHHWRGRTRETLAGEVAFEAVTVGRPGGPLTRLATFHDN